MAKARKPKSNPDPIVTNIEKQFERLFGQHEIPPAPINVRQMEELKQRVAELEAKLTQQPSAALQESTIRGGEPDSRAEPTRASWVERGGGTKQFAYNALRITLIGLPASVIAAGLYLYLALTIGAWQLYAWSADIWLLALAVLISLVLIRRNHVAWAVWLLLTAIQVTFIGAVALIDGIGLVVGVSIAILVSLIAGQTLSAKAVNRASILGVVSGLVAVLLDSLGLAYRLPQPEPIRVFLPAILGIVILLYGFVIVRQFPSYSLRTKLVLAFIVIAVASVGTVAFTIGRSLRSNLTNDIGNNMAVLANAEAYQISQKLEDELDLLNGLALGRAVQDRAESASASDSLSTAQINQLDQTWRAADAANNNTDPLVSRILNDNLSSELLKYQARFPENVEVFLTDLHGVNIAATNRTSDYLQSDEAWWQAALKEGQYVGQPEYDASTKTLAINMAVAVYANGSNRIVGVLRTTVNITSLSNVLSAGEFGNTGHTHIYLPDGEEVKLSRGGDGKYELALEEADTDIKALAHASKRYLNVSLDGVPSLASVAPVAAADVSNQASQIIKDLGWYVATHEDQAEALKPVEAQTNNLLVLAFAVAIIAAFAAIGLAQALAGPLVRLNAVAEKVASGDLSVQAKVETGDEAGALATTFNNMLFQLRGSIGTLEQRVAERTHDLRVASEVGRVLGEKSADLYMLLEEAVELIRERFHLYYAQIYLADAGVTLLTLRAGTGQAGQELLGRGHQLPVNSASINGRAAAEKQPVIVADTQQSSNFLPNPLLPKTCSEMAIPLIAGGRVVGVLDMQSDRPGALNEQNLPAFEALAGQLAVALQNAALFAEAKEARSEVEAQVRRLTEHGWQNFLDAIEHGEKIAYASDQVDVIPLAPGALAGAPQAAVSAPISLGEAKIGAIELVDEPGRAWTESETELLRLAAGQLAQHLQNLRLLGQAEQYRAEAEEAARRLTREGWSALESTRLALPGYIYNLSEVKPLDPESNESPDDIVKQSLVVRNEAIGELAAQAQPNSEEALEIITAVAGQLSGHLENLRLFEQTERALVETEQLSHQNALILGAAGEGIFGLDGQGNHTFVNPAAAEMLGYTPDELIGVHSHSTWHYSRPDGSVYPDTECPIYATIHDGRIHRGEEYFRRRDGTGFPVGFTSTPVREGDRIVGAVVTFRDITELKQAEEGLRVAQERAQTILESITLPMVITRLSDNLLTFVNQPATEVVGLRYEDAINQPAPNFYYDLDERKNFIAELRAHGRVSDMTVQLMRANGEPFWALLSARVFDYRGEPSILSTFADVTDRMRAQQSVARRAAELQTVAEVSTTTATTLEPDRLLQSVVDLTKSQFGLYHAHIYLAEQSWQTLLLAAGAGERGRQMVAEGHTIPIDAEQSLVARAVRTRQAIIVNDVRSDPGFLPNPLLPDTRSEMAVPMIVGDKVLGVFDVQSGAVDHFTAEDAYIYTTLASQVAIALQNARLYVEQSATVAQLRELDRLKSSFLANMSHELRTPLNSILGFAEVILDELDGPLTDNMDNDLRLIQKNGQHLLHLINDVLDMAKIEAGRMNLNPEKFQLHAAMEEVISITSPLATEKGLSLVIDEKSDREVEIVADRTRIQQVMINVANNALKFTDHGTIRLCAERYDHRVLISVRDTGIGIPPDQLEAVFQEFTQVDTSATRKVGGTGLGLPISRRLIDMHGGRMWAESDGIAGEGSVFYIELPLEAVSTSTVEKPPR